ncbi:MAG: class I SAM-dependent methyltransferase [Candidatus Cyclobacteriaceae bacterium M3_2C_046]
MSLFDFNGVADQYDQYYHTETGQLVDLQEKNLLNHFLKKLAKPEILEIGCGTGHWTAYLSQKGFRVTGMDLSEKMLDQAKKRQILGAELLLMDAHQLAFTDNSADQIIMITVLEFTENPDQVISEVYRVLKPGGHFILAGLNQHSWLGQHKHQDPVFRSARFFTPLDLKDYLQKFGQPDLKGTVFFDDNGQIKPDPSSSTTEQAAFLAGFVKKTII